MSITEEDHQAATVSKEVEVSVHHLVALKESHRGFEPKVHERFLSQCTIVPTGQTLSTGRIRERSSSNSSTCHGSSYKASAAAECKAAVRDIVDAVSANGGLPYFDHSFYFDRFENIYPTGTPEDTTAGVPRRAARLQQLFPETPLFGPATEVSVTQGELGDAFLLGAALALARSPELGLGEHNAIGQLFADYDRTVGVYGLVFFKNGAWEWVIVDDFVAVREEDGQPLYAKSTTALWPMIVEKAYAKLHGSWDSIDGGWAHEALSDLVGGTTLSYDLHRHRPTFENFSELVHKPSTCVIALLGSQWDEAAEDVLLQIGLCTGRPYGVVGASTTTEGEPFVLVYNPFPVEVPYIGPRAGSIQFPNNSTEDSYWIPWETFVKYLTDIHSATALGHRTNILTVWGCQVPVEAAGKESAESAGEQGSTTAEEEAVAMQRSEDEFILYVEPEPSGQLQPVTFTLGQQDCRTFGDHSIAKSESYALLKLLITPVAETEDLDLVPAAGLTLLDPGLLPTHKKYANSVDDTLSLPGGWYRLAPVLLHNRIPEGRAFYVRVAVNDERRASIWLRRDRKGTIRHAMVVSGSATSSNSPARSPSFRSQPSASQSAHTESVQDILRGSEQLRCKPSSEDNLSRCCATAVLTRSSARSPRERMGSWVATDEELRRMAIAECSTAVRTIAELCHRQTKPYFDSSFYFDVKNNVYPPGTSSTSAVGVPKAATRLAELFPHLDLFGPAERQSTAVTALEKGAINDEFLLSTLTALHQTPSFPSNSIPQLFADYDRTVGVYGLVFFKNGAWEWVIVDDFVAVREEDDQPLYAKSTTALWPMIVEKAYAKLHGSWDSIDGGTVADPMVDLTGGITTSLDLRKRGLKDLEIQKFLGLPDSVYIALASKHSKDSTFVESEPWTVIGLSSAETADGSTEVRVLLTDTQLRTQDLSWSAFLHDFDCIHRLTLRTGTSQCGTTSCVRAHFDLVAPAPTTLSTYQVDVPHVVHLFVTSRTSITLVLGSGDSRLLGNHPLGKTVVNGYPMSMTISQVDGFSSIDAEGNGNGAGDDSTETILLKTMHYEKTRQHSVRHTLTEGVYRIVLPRRICSGTAAGAFLQVLGAPESLGAVEVVQHNTSLKLPQRLLGLALSAEGAGNSSLVPFRPPPGMRISYHQRGGLESALTEILAERDPWQRGFLDRRMADQALVQLLLNSDAGSALQSAVRQETQTGPIAHQRLFELAQQFFSEDFSNVIVAPLAGVP